MSTKKFLPEPYFLSFKRRKLVSEAGMVINDFWKTCYSRFNRALQPTSLILFTLLLVPLPAGGWPVDSYHQMRYENVRGQDTSASCGPASLSTLFTNFFNRDVSEDQIIEIILPGISEEFDEFVSGSGLPEGGVSMLDLKVASVELGVEAKGFKVPEDNLLPLVDSLSLPVLLHLEKPDEHFVLLLGSTYNKAILADPSWGLRTVTPRLLFSRWGGLIIGFQPDPDSIKYARDIVGTIKKEVSDMVVTQEVSLDLIWH